MSVLQSKAGESAFPTTEEHYAISAGVSGLTKREYMSSQILAAMVGSRPGATVWDWTKVPKAAVDLADALLREIQQRENDEEKSRLENSRLQQEADQKGEVSNG